MLIALKQFRIGGIFTDALSWITFAQGGLGNGLRGIVGGLFGKVVVASGIYALLDGGKDIANGIKKWFNCFNASSDMYFFKNSFINFLLAVTVAVPNY